MPEVIQSTTVRKIGSRFAVEIHFVPPSALVEENGDFVHFQATLPHGDQFPRLAELQLIALQHVQAQLDIEIQRLRSEQGRNP